MDRMPKEDDESPVSTAPATPTSPMEFKMLPLFMDFEDFVRLLLRGTGVATY